MQIVLGTPNDLKFAVARLTGSSAAVEQVSPTFGSGVNGYSQPTVVACDGDWAAVANWKSQGEVLLYDLTTTPLATHSKRFAPKWPGGVGAVAIDGQLVLIGERNGKRVLLIDFSRTPPVALGAPALHPAGDVSSVSLEGRRAVAATGNSGQILMAEFPASTGGTVSQHLYDPGLSAPVVALTSGHVAVAARHHGQVKLVSWDLSSPQVVSQATTRLLGGIHSISKLGDVVAMGSDNSQNTICLADFAHRTHPAVLLFRIERAHALTGGASVSLLPGAQQLAVADRSGWRVNLVDVANWQSKQNNSELTVSGSTRTTGSVSRLTTAGSTLTDAADAPLGFETKTGKSAKDLPFGVVRVAQKRELSVYLKNPGASALRVTRIVVGGPGRGSYRASPTGPLTLRGNGTTRVSVTFEPASKGSFSASLEARTDGPNASLSLSGEGGLPDVSKTPKKLLFGSIAKCTSSQRTLAIKNSGNVALEIESIQASGPFRAPPLKRAVQPGEDLPWPVTFDPKGAKGPLRGGLTIASDDPDHPGYAVALEGTGVDSVVQIALSAKKLDWGSLPAHEFAGQRLTLHNNSRCEKLVVSSIETGHKAFSLTADPHPTTLPATTSLGKLTIEPGKSKGLVVAFGPTEAKPYSSTLKIASNDPDQPVLHVGLTGRGAKAETAAVSLILDRSGSMADKGQGGIVKMAALKSAAGLFLNLVPVGKGDEIASVEFDDKVTELTALAPVTGSEVRHVESRIATLTPRDYTSIGGGLDLGRSQLEKSSIRRRVLLVFTDGKNNSGPSPKDVKKKIEKAGAEVYAVALGTTASIDKHLPPLAEAVGGKFFGGHDLLMLRKHFLQVLTDAFRKDIVKDPVRRIDRGKAIDLPVTLTRCEHRVRFVCAWEDPGEVLDLEVIAPDGYRYTPSSPLSNRAVEFGQGDGYAYYNLVLPPITGSQPGTIGPAALGVWTLRVTARRLSSASQRFVTSVVVDSDFHMTTRLTSAPVGASGALEVQLECRGNPVSGATVRARFDRPARSTAAQIAAVAPGPLVALDAPGLADGGDLATLGSLGVPLLTLTETRSEMLQGEEIGASGIYRVTLPPFRHDGFHQVEIDVEAAACDGVVHRYAIYTLAPEQIMGEHETETEVEPDPRDPGLVHVHLTPRDAAGNLLGPGRAHEIEPRGSRGLEVLDVRDLATGSYDVLVAREAGGTLWIELAGGELAVDVPGPAEAEPNPDDPGPDDGSCSGGEATA